MTQAIDGAATYGLLFLENQQLLGKETSQRRQEAHELGQGQRRLAHAWEPKNEPSDGDKIMQLVSAVSSVASVAGAAGGVSAAVSAPTTPPPQTLPTPAEVEPAALPPEPAPDQAKADGYGLKDGISDAYSVLSARSESQKALGDEDQGAQVEAEQRVAESWDQNAGRDQALAETERRITVEQLKLQSLFAQPG